MHGARGTARQSSCWISHAHAVCSTTERRWHIIVVHERVDHDASSRCAARARELVPHLRRRLAQQPGDPDVEAAEGREEEQQHVAALRGREGVVLLDLSLSIHSMPRRLDIPFFSTLRFGAKVSMMITIHLRHEELAGMLRYLLCTGAAQNPWRESGRCAAHMTVCAVRDLAGSPSCSSPG